MTNTPLTSKRRKALSAAGVAESSAKDADWKLGEAKQKVEAQIDAFMKSVGYPEPAQRTDERGWRYFGLGSAEGRAGVVESDGELYLRVEAPILPLPADKDLILPLMRELLELNLTIPGEGRVGMKADTVFAAITYPAAILADESIGRCIHAVMSLADGLDDVLIEKYGGTSRQRGGI